MSRKVPPDDAPSFGARPFAVLAGLVVPPGAPAVTPLAGASAPGPRLGRLVVRREKKGHGGKVVTAIDGVPASDRDRVVGLLKKKLGTGARVEGDQLHVQGDLVERVASLLEAEGAAKVIRGN